MIYLTCTKSPGLWPTNTAKPSAHGAYTSASCNAPATALLNEPSACAELSIQDGPGRLAAVPDLTDKFRMRNCSNREPCSERPAPLSILTVHSHPKRYVF